MNRPELGAATARWPDRHPANPVRGESGSDFVIGFSMFAALQIVAAILCLYIISKSSLKSFWESLGLCLVGIVIFGAALRIAWDIFGIDAAFYLASVVFPYSSAAMGILLMLSLFLFASRLLGGNRA